MRHLLITILLLDWSASIAQEAPRLSFGPHIDLNAKWVKMIPYEARPKFTPSVGLQINFQFRDKFSLQAETNYLFVKSRTTYRRDFSADTYEIFEMDFSIGYIELPIVFNHKLSLGERMKLNSGLGCSFRRALDGKLNPKSTLTSPPAISTVDGPPIDIDDNTDFVLFCPLVQTAFDLQINEKNQLKFFIRYSVSSRSSIRGKTPPELTYNYGYNLNMTDNRLNTLSIGAALLFGKR